MKIQKFVLPVIIFALAAVLCLCFFVFSSVNNIKTLQYSGEDIVLKRSVIQDVYTDKSAYLPGQTAEIIVEMQSDISSPITACIYVVLKHIDKEVNNFFVKEITLNSPENIKEIIKLKLPDRDFTGYLLEVWLKDHNDFIDMKSTAIDVSSKWTRFPRYGYIASYPKQSPEKSAEIIDNLSKFHINALQFYDWQYKHHEPIKLVDGQLPEYWTEISKKRVYINTIKDYITEAHAHNIAAMNYNLLFGAWDKFEEDGIKKEWGLYKYIKKGEQKEFVHDYHSLPATWASSRIYLINPFNKNWQNYILQKERQVFEYFDFDGWHIDQLGNRGDTYDYQGNPVNLPEGYADFLNAARAALGQNCILVFNAVDRYGQMSIARNPVVDFLYTEVWDTSSYRSLKAAIDDSAIYTDNQLNIVIAGYMNYKKANGEFNEHSVRMANAVIIAAGGAHIELGDKGMLSSEYFPSVKLNMSDSLINVLRNYYDFMVAYQNLLRYGQKNTNNKITINGIPSKKGGSKDSIWYFTKKKDNTEILHLINFMGLESVNWRDDFGNMAPPDFQKSIKLKYYTENDISKALLMSPDFENISPLNLDFIQGTDNTGKYIELLIPEIQYWDMIVFEAK